MRKKTLAGFGMMAVTIGLAFQNCSQVGFSQGTSATTDNAAGTPAGVGGDGGVTVGTSTATGGNDGGNVVGSLQSTHAVFAVRAMNCVACHGVFNSSIVTDFGYGGPNFTPSRNGNSMAFAPNNTDNTWIRSAYNNIDDGPAIGGWDSMTVNGGSIHVPSATIPASTSNSAFGMNSATTFPQLLEYTGFQLANGASMVSGVTPAAGQQAVITDSTIVIGYPSQSEILNLLPASSQSSKLAIAAVQVSGSSTTSQISGLGGDSSGNFVRNTGSTIVCYGDVAIKGPLFLKNVQVQTDGNGCRLYVSQTVFIQGPITYIGGVAGENMQITSSSAILMGFSAQRMGANLNGSSSGDSVRTGGDSVPNAGGPWPRFSTNEDLEYNPSGGAINGVAPGTFFDNMVLDAEAIGSELLDAGDAAAINNLATGETVVTEPSNGDNSEQGGSRVAVNYNALLLNAPHVHSRYGGNFQGVIIAEVVMLARNQAAQTLETYTYDTTFDTIPVSSLLPALTTPIFNVVP